MKVGILTLLVALASCVLPFEPSDFASSEVIQNKYKRIDQANITTAKAKEFYPQLSNPCSQDYSRLSYNYEFLTKLDCALEKQNG